MLSTTSAELSSAMSFEKVYPSSLPHSINAVQNDFYHCNDIRIRSDRRLLVIENLNKAVKIRAKISVKYGCSDKWNRQRVALQDALGLRTDRPSDQDSRSVIEKMETQRSSFRRPPNFVLHLSTCRRVEGWRDSCMLWRKAA